MPYTARRHKSPVQSPEVRRENFDEVIQGYSLKDALDEADRCITCENARCQESCPLHNNIPQWMDALKNGRIEDAYRIIRQTSPMPELCSRLCPQERLCEGACGMGIRHESVAIGLLERFVTDEHVKKIGRNSITPRQLSKSEVKKVAAVGSGPASLSFAQVMAREGHHVVVFERWAHLGGVLRWIPRFKMPPAILDQHIEMLLKLGVTFKTGVEIQSAQELLDQGYDGVFLGIGASRPSIPKIPGVTLTGVLSSTEFLVRVYYDPKALPNKWQPLTELQGQKVVVLGGGDSAMDCVRTAVRLGAKEVTCLYRRDEKNMPGSKKEVKAAKEEGVQMQYLASPVRFHSKDGKSVSEVECVRMELGPPDASGRRSPVPIKDSEFTTAADLVVLAFGYEVEPIFKEKENLMTPKSIVKINPTTGATPIPLVLAGGDCATGPNLVCTAAYAGVTAAQGLLRHFAGESWSVLTSSSTP